MKTSFYLLLLSALLMSLPALATDTDGDGMEDAWETSMGLNLNDDTDAFADKDGDRVPNLWEFARSTDANNAASVPTYDAFVCRFPLIGQTPPQFGTLQEAYDSLPATAGYYSVVKVMRGDYPAVLDGATTAKRVAWIAESGADRATELEGVCLKPLAYFGEVTGDNQDSLVFHEETVMDGFIIDGRTANFLHPAIQAVSQTTSLTEIRLVNTLLRNWFAADVESGVAGGGIDNQGCIMWLVHCTLWRACAWDGTTERVLGIVNNQTGSELHLYNTIIGDPTLLGQGESILTGELDAVWGDSCLLQGSETVGYGAPGQLTNTYEYEAALTLGGYVSSASPAIDAAGTHAISKDIYNQTRPAGDEDIGAMEWVNTDYDTLPDWWELFWFGNLNQGPEDNPDGDWSVNADCFYYHLPPISDQDSDGDGLTDTLEVTYFGDLGETAAGDYDLDGLTNALEILILFSNPTLADTNSDGFSDGLAYFLGLSLLGDDTDGDGLSNAWELAHGTHYFLADSDGDDVPDDEDELPLVALASVGSIVAGPPLITLTAPASAVLIP